MCQALFLVLGILQSPMRQKPCSHETYISMKLYLGPTMCFTRNVIHKFNSNYLPYLN